MNLGIQSNYIVHWGSKGSFCISHCNSNVRVGKLLFTLFLRNKRITWYSYHGTTCIYSYSCTSFCFKRKTLQL